MLQITCGKFNHCNKAVVKFCYYDDNKKYIYSFCEACFKKELKASKERKISFIKLTELSEEKYLEILRK